MNPNPRILLVDDEPEILRALERSLRADFQITTAETAAKALEFATKEDFAVIVSDQRMPGMSGTEFLAKVAQEKPLTTRIILTAHTDTKEILEAINRAEIYRYVTKPWDNAELLTTVKQAANHHDILNQNAKLVTDLQQLNQKLEKLVESRTSELRAANEKLAELAMTDPLTKIPNRRAMVLKLSEELERSKRYKHEISFAMIDVDHFKSFNDMEGHVYGDEALKKVAQLFLAKLRKTDILTRYGGEEFLLMMPETKVSVAYDICERLRKSIEENTFQGANGPAYLTVSIGVSSFPQNGDTQESLIKAADQALYQAKEWGRNRVVAGN